MHVRGHEPPAPRARSALMEAIRVEDVVEACDDVLRRIAWNAA